MELSSLAGILWVAGFAAECVLFAILCFRRRTKSFPVFCAYIGLSAVRSIVLFWLWRHSQWNVYRIMYWSFMLCDTCLQFCLLWEIASTIFRRRGTWAPDVSGRLAVWSFASVALAGALTALLQPAGHGWFQSAVLRADFFPSVLISELFVVMLVLSSKAGLNWRNHVASITVGFAVFNVPSVVVNTIASVYGFDQQGYLSGFLENARKELYLACVIYWCYSMWRPEPKPRIMSPRMEGQVSALRDVLVHRNDNWSGR